MTHDEYVKRRDEILDVFLGELDQVAPEDWIAFAESDQPVAKRAIDKLVLDVIGEDVAIKVNDKYDLQKLTENNLKLEQRNIVTGEDDGHST